MRQQTCQDCARAIGPRRQQRPDGAAEHRGRGLCTACYERARYAGRLDAYPPVRRSRWQVAEDWAFLRSCGVTRAQAAARLGMTEEALRKALYRARSAA